METISPSLRLMSSVLSVTDDRRGTRDVEVEEETRKEGCLHHLHSRLDTRVAARSAAEMDVEYFNEPTVTLTLDTTIRPTDAVFTQQNGQPKIDYK